MTQEALKLALEGVEIHSPNSPEYIVCAALIEALAQTQEPVAWVVYSSAENDIVWADKGKRLKQNTPLYTTPSQPEQEPVKMVAYNCTCGRTMKFESVHGVVAPQRKPLTDEEIEVIAKNYALNNPTTPLHFARAIEAAHGIKE
jgi:hypothetical protein